MPGVITATWSGSYTRTPTAYAPGYPAISPLAVAVSNTAGQWLFAVVSWRQDAGTTGVLKYPSGVAVSDDAHNFWIPVQTGAPQTGIVRCAVWMAPAARQAEFVFVSPTAYQSALTALVMEVTADCPWYSVAAQAQTSINQGGSITLSQSPAAGIFSVGVVAWDNSTAIPVITATGWTATTSVDTNNATDHSGDLHQRTYTLTSSGGTQTISAASAATQDWAEVIIAVQGVTNVLPFPYSLPMENWPVLVTEIGAGAVQNVNPLFLNGASNWAGQNASVAAVNWPAWNPWPYYQTLITQSLQVTPSGSAAFGNAASEQEAVSPFIQYGALAYAYSAAGYATGTFNVFINWFTSGSGFISTSNGPAVVVPAGAWTQLSLASPVYPPANAAFATVGVVETANAGNVPSSQIFYIGYCGFGPADSYEGAAPDQIQWSDFSSRNFTEQQISIGRGIQYEQQSLEAGTMTVTLANNDYAVMYGNTESPFWPTIGDTDVPIRLRAIWPGSITPYTVLFSGYTDDVDFGYNAATRYSYASFTCSDEWSRLTQQLLGAAEEDVLDDAPQQYMTCSQSGANLAPGGTGVAAPADAAQGAGSATASFTASSIALDGDPGVSCWQNTLSGTSPNAGIALGYYPPGGAAVLPSVAAGVTVEFWMSPVVVSASQPASQLVVCSCWGSSNPLWTITINNTGGAGSSTASVSVYDKTTGTPTTTSLGATLYLSATNAVLPWYFGVTFTQGSLTVVTNPGGTVSTTTTVSCNLGASMVGFSWGGNAGPILATNPAGTSYGFMEIAVYGIAVYNYLVPPARLASHYATASTAFPLEIDTARIARIAGWSGFVPTLAMRCQDLSPASNLVDGTLADLDAMTAATDTNGQVVSDYFTNVAQSTLAFLFVDGPGTLQYRRRLEAYDRPVGQFALGEQVTTPLNTNTLNQFGNFLPWQPNNNATLVMSGQPAVAAGPLFSPVCAVFHGNGVTAAPQISYGFLSFFNGVNVTPGNWYTFSAWLYSPQGFGNGTTTGLTLTIQWVTAGFTSPGTAATAITAIAAGSLLYLQVPAAQAPATAAYAWLYIQVAGTPASSVLFYVADAVLAQVNPVMAGGNGVTAAEAPYLVDVKMSSDRAQLFNQAILTQYGTNTQETFTGTNITFTPSSGVVVQISNFPSIAQRGDVPYTATLYLDNTAQALPYFLDEPSMEDFGNWIVQTLGQPLFRPLTITVTPTATTGTLQTGLQAEVGDTFTFRRRHLGVPEMQILTYCSRLTHNIDIAGGAWRTSYELSPFPQGTTLACDDVIHGCGTGGNSFGW